MIAWNLLLVGTRVTCTHACVQAEVPLDRDNWTDVEVPLGASGAVVEYQLFSNGGVWTVEWDLSALGTSVFDEPLDAVEIDEPETAEEYHARTGEPWGAGEDTFERAMRARYPERGAS